MFTVMITGCASLSKGIIDFLKGNENGEEVRVVGVNSSPLNLLRTGVDAAYVVPPVIAPNYLEEMLNICVKEKVDIILPFITRELPIISKLKPYFDAIGTKVSVSSYETILVANDKLEMLKRYPQYMPKQAVAHNVNDVLDFSHKIGYPKTKYCSKLANKQGGLGFMVIDSEKAYNMNLFNLCGENRYVTQDYLFKILENNNNPEIILQEYIEGVDYSVSALADNGKALYLCGFAGYSMEYGSVTNGEIVYNEKAYKIAEEVISDLNLDGNLCLDYKLKPDGDVVLLEVNPRLNASLPFVCEAGINMPYLRCEMLLGRDIANKGYKPKYGLKMNRYYEYEYHL